MVNINPLKTSAEISSTYGRYLKSLVQPRQVNLAQAIADAIDKSIAEPGGIVKGPFLEATPPYVTGHTIRELVADGTLSDEFLKLGNNSFPLDRPVYQHQEDSIRKIGSGRSVLVATGTGSGKTESFLIPIINHLMREKEAGTLGSGVRALLLYPMNALANDQVKRIRDILSGYTSITFGRYTGETLETQERASQQFLQREGKKPAPNELISREQMRETPPHILLTNYAMLEYLLLRPEDHEIFNGSGSDTWKFIVADEAHTYDGAHGVEVALLLKKLRERVDKPNSIITIGTTATIGGTDKEKEVFATNFFGNTYAIASNEAGFRDLVEPQRLEIGAGTWSNDDANWWAKLSSEGDFIAGTSAVGISGSSPSSIFVENKQVCQIRQLLLKQPATVFDVALEVFGSNSEISQQAVVQIVELGTEIKDAYGNPSFQARFHLFARATEGVFSCLAETPHAYLSRHLACPDCNSPSYELAGCKRCGASYFAGHVVDQSGKTFFVPGGTTEKNQQTTYAYPVEFASNGDNEDEVVFDDDSLPESDEEITANSLCASCGFVSIDKSSTCPECASQQVFEVRFTKQSNKCEVCAGLGSGIIRKLESGNDAAAAVLATSLYQDLPPAPLGAHAHLPGEGRKLMVFSDSRQQAAFFAPYLEDSYKRLLWRRLIMKALSEAERAHPDEEISFVDLKPFLTNEARSANILPTSSNIAQQNLVLTRLYWEAVSTDLQTNLEGTGLVSWQYRLPENEEAYKPLIALGFSAEDARSFLSEILNSLRINGIVQGSAGIDLGDEIFKPRTGPLYIRENAANPQIKTYAWLPKSASNSRLDYTNKVFEALKIEADPVQFLKGIWDALSSPNGRLSGLLVSQSVGTQGIVFSLNPESVLVKSVSAAGHVFRCALCRRTTAVSAGDVCPRFRCKGSLEKIFSLDIESTIAGSHYATLYSSVDPIGMIASEHTAQLETEYAAQVQQDFIEGRVNVLSSSTTFELGVDVGELQAVLLRNMPPSVANYIQRAGRAGRRADSAALILTYAQRRPHDLSMFGDPVSMVAGKMRSPYVDLHNERILERHIFSLIFATFFRSVGLKTLPKAGQFLAPDGGVGNQLVAWVNENTVALKPRFEAVLPSVLISKSDQLWLNLPGEFAKRFNSVREVFQNEVAQYEALIRDLLDPKDAAVASSKAMFEAARLSKTLKTITEKDLIGFLSKNNLIPKYGFPVDTVPLVPRRGESSLAQNIELDRDLAVAIFDYAPGAQVIAAGVIWESIGLVLPAKAEKGFQKYRYAVCKECQEYQQQIFVEGTGIARCQSCGSTNIRSDVYLVPEWGFHAAGGSKKPGESIKRYKWNRSIHLKDHGEVVLVGGRHTPPGVKAELRSVAKLVVLNAGPANKGYSLCTWCNDAHPFLESQKKTDHETPYDGSKSCKGKFRDYVHLGHVFETDIVHLSIDLARSSMNAKAVASSLAYALLEGASEGLQIAHDDIDVVPLPSTDTEVRLALVDSVPGGAGFAKLIAENVNQVFDAAWGRVSRCECGLESSCYQCLRSFKNQREHEELKRGLALESLKYVLGKN